MMFVTLPNTIVSERGVEQREAPGLEVIDLENATCLSSKNAIYSTAWRTEPSEWGWERATSCKLLQGELKGLGLWNSSQIEA